MSSGYGSGGVYSGQGVVKKVCAFCRNFSLNPVLKEVVVSHGLVVHLNCLYTTGKLIQRVNLNTQFFVKHDWYMFGFDIQEIKLEICCDRRLRCRYCDTSGACIGCINKACCYSVRLPVFIMPRVLCILENLLKPFTTNTDRNNVFPNGNKKPNISEDGLKLP
ncbi:hypothetical protein TcWFU_005166 [Taenia crassiceps]|uniref:Uncharacterized protein n=1 Tax=Taenia crassiceps TaxID=6207 RepID=A0ABR4QHB5_9CEST